MARSKPNQFKVVRKSDLPKDAEHLYGKINLGAVQQAMQELGEYEFKLYMILSMNQVDYVWNLTPEYLVENCGGCDASWRRAREGLLQKKYLVNKGNFTLEFYETPVQLSAQDF